MTVRRVMGTETEYAVSLVPSHAPNVDVHDIDDSGEQHRHGSERLPRDPVALSYAVVAAARDPRLAHIAWDYGTEDPLNDARGTRLPRSRARTDMLTDRPQSDVVNTVAPNGARIYVDHAHPEYSSPETLDPFEALAYDRAGDMLMQEAADSCRDPRSGSVIALHKNNTDGKGASWGTHENYTVDRSVPFGRLADLITAHLVTRQIYTGAGRVGIGEHDEVPGFQLAQRADFIHTAVGLQTTFDRPIINTRDESHTLDTLRRLHVIMGDANRMDMPQVLKLGTTSLLLWLLEHGQEDDLDAVISSLRFADPVTAVHEVSHDMSLSKPLTMSDGMRLTAWQIQTRLLTAVYRGAARVYGTDTRGEPNWPDAPTRRVIAAWVQALQDVATIAHADDDTRLQCNRQAGRLEWLLKWQLLERLRRRHSLSWADPVLAAVDIRWAALDPAQSLFDRAAQLCEHVLDDAAFTKAMRHPPASTRAWLRGALIRRCPQRVTSLSWSRITLQMPQDGGRTFVIHMPDAREFDELWCRRAILDDTTAALDERLRALLKNIIGHG